MDSFEILRTQNHSGSFPSAEYSFLPEVPCAIPNGDVNHHVCDNYDLANMQSALASTIPDSTVQVQAQLLELIEENNSLKEKLNKNNAMMKEQMSTISAWREHMIATKDQQQQSLEKAKEKIAALEKDNADLLEKINLAGRMTRVDDQTEKPGQCMKCLIFEAALNNMLALDSVEDGDSFFYDISYFRENLLENLKHIASRIESLINPNSKGEETVMLKTYIMLLKFKIASIEDGNLKATVQTDDESGFEIVYKKKRETQMQLLQDIEDLKIVIQQKDFELNCVKKEKEELFEKTKLHESELKDLEARLKSELELMNKKLEMEASLFEKYKKRCENLQKQTEEYQAKLDTSMSKDPLNAELSGELQEEIQNLRDILKLEEQAKKELMEKNADIMHKCEIMQVDYDRVLKLLEIQSKDEKEKDEKMAAEKENATKEYFERIDQLMAQLFEKEEQMREKDSEIMKLENELAKAREKEENIPILKAQVELYKTDYENLESAKNAASNEIERLKNELRKLEKCESCNSASGGKKHGKHSPSTNKEPECPFCSLTFKTLRLVEHHIQRVHEDTDAGKAYL